MSDIPEESPQVSILSVSEANPDILTGYYQAKILAQAGIKRAQVLRLHRKDQEASMSRFSVVLDDGSILGSTHDKDIQKKISDLLTKHPFRAGPNDRESARPAKEKDRQNGIATAKHRSYTKLDDDLEMEVLTDVMPGEETMDLARGTSSGVQRGSTTPLRYPRPEAENMSVDSSDDFLDISHFNSKPKEEEPCPEAENMSDNSSGDLLELNFPTSDPKGKRPSFFHRSFGSPEPKQKQESLAPATPSSNQLPANENISDSTQHKDPDVSTTTIQLEKGISTSRHNTPPSDTPPSAQQQPVSPSRHPSAEASTPRGRTRLNSRSGNRKRAPSMSPDYHIRRLLVKIPRHDSKVTKSVKKFKKTGRDAKKHSGVINSYFTKL